MESARINALTELIERDAIMQNWFSNDSAPVLADTLLPIHILKKKYFWREKGRNVFLIDLPSPYATVILAVIVSDQYPCFVCGASATISISKDKLDNVCNKAFQEAEYCLYSCLKRPNLKKYLQTQYNYQVSMPDSIISLIP